MKRKLRIALLLKKARTFLVNHPRCVPHLNGKSFKSKKVIKSLSWHLFALVWGLTLIEIGKAWVFNNFRDETDTCFAIVDKYLSDNGWLNALLTISVFISLLIWLKHVFDDRFLSLKRLIIAVWLTVIFAFGRTFTFVYCAIGLDYLSIFCFVLFVQILFELKKLWGKRWLIETIGVRGKCYVTEVPQEGLDKKVRIGYAKNVAELLFNTNISDASFALGITNEWGSGKTSFLLDMKRAMNGKCYMIDFKPWNCQTPDQIINEFFELFRKQIKNVYSPLQKPILRYARLLSDVELPSYIKPVFDFLPKMENSIDDCKKVIEEGLKQLDKPMVVTVDDIDRLAADEMFEVLRLIRNTAAFPNLIYIVCYDKGYVVRQIQNKGISDSDLYLEKIFPLELSLPKTEEENLIETFRHSLINMHFMRGRLDSLVKNLAPEDRSMMVRLLPTYRKMKRFARLLETNVSFITRKVGEKDVDLYDLFLIELLHFCMQDVYMILRDRPEVLIKVIRDPSTKQARYILRDNYYEEINGKRLSQYEDRLLNKCFEKRMDTKTHCMAYVDSYQNYFCMATPDVMISKEEFASVASNRSTIRKNVHDWFWRIPAKKSSSLYSRMMSVRIKELLLEDWKNYVYLMMAWMCETEDSSICDVFDMYLLKENLRVDLQDDYTKATQYLKVKLMNIIGSQKVDRMNVAKVLCGYYMIVENKQSDYLMNCKDIKDLLCLNFKMFMNEKPLKQDAINVVALNGNDVNAFVKANCIEVSIGDGLNGFPSISHNNLIIGNVIDYFSAYKEKSSHLKEAQRMYVNGKNRYKTLPDIQDVDLKKEKSCIFGNEENYHIFLNKCFVERKNH